jgi:hypothetical protein
MMDWPSAAFDRYMCVPERSVVDVRARDGVPAVDPSGSSNARGSRSRAAAVLFAIPAALGLVSALVGYVISPDGVAGFGVLAVVLSAALTLPLWFAAAVAWSSSNALRGAAIPIGIVYGVPVLLIAISGLMDALGPQPNGAASRELVLVLAYGAAGLMLVVAAALLIRTQKRR